MRGVLQSVRPVYSYKLSDMEMSIEVEIPGRAGNALGSLGCFWPRGKPEETARVEC